MSARILVVEASHVRTLIADVLKAEEHQVQCVTNGAETLGLLEQRSTFDLLLSDLTLPAIEGVQLYWEIGARWPHLVARLICVTDGTSPGMIDHQTLRGLGPVLGEAVLGTAAAGSRQEQTGRTRRAMTSRWQHRRR